MNLNDSAVLSDISNKEIIFQDYMHNVNTEGEPKTIKKKLIEINQPNDYYFRIFLDGVKYFQSTLLNPDGHDKYLIEQVLFLLKR